MRIKLFATVALAMFIFQASAIPALALTKKVSGGEVVDKRDYPVIFIPGAAGSNLDVGGVNRWPGDYSLTSDALFDALALGADGKSPVSGPPAVVTKVMRYGSETFQWSQTAVYQGFYDYMEAQGYKYEKNEETGKVFFDFPYDWRQDNHRWTGALDAKVDAVLKATKAEKVILVGHSMGGIQIRLYMLDAKRAKKVGGVVFMATPHHGAPQVLWSYTQGYNFGNPKVSDEKMWAIMRNWEAGYQLLPDWPAIRDKKTGRFWTLEEQYGDGFVSVREQERHLAALAAGKQSVVSYGLPNKEYRERVIPFHAEFGNAVAPYDGKYWMIEGNGYDTVQYLNATLTPVPGFDKPLLTLEKVKTKLGDETVPLPGASVQGATVFQVKAKHGEVPSNGAAQGHMTEIRKEVNDEEFRKSLPEKAKSYAVSKLADLERRKTEAEQGEPQDDGEPNIAMILFRVLFMGQKDEKKVQLRDDLIRYARSMFKNARVNVTIAESDGHKEDTVYAYVIGYEVQETGNGGFVKPTVTAEVSSYDVYNKIMGGGDAVAYIRSGDVKLGGSGATGFKLKLFQWISKYVKG